MALPYWFSWWMRWWLDEDKAVRTFMETGRHGEVLLSIDLELKIRWFVVCFSK